MNGGRIEKSLPEDNLLPVKILVILAARGLDNAIFRIIALDNRYPPALALQRLRPPRTSDHLRQKLEWSLGRAEIRPRKTLVGEDYTDKPDRWKIEPLRDHLRPEKHIDLVLTDRLYDS